MSIILAIMGICIGLFSVGIAIFSFGYSLTLSPNAYLFVSTIKAYQITGLGFMIGAPIAFLLFGASRWFIKYKIIFGVPTGDISVRFYLNWLEKFLLLNMPLDWGEARVEVRYRYGEVLGWQDASPSVWKELIGIDSLVTIGSKVTIKGSTKKWILLFEREPNGQKFTIHRERHALPDYFDYKISIIFDTEKKFEYCDSYEQLTLT